ncbi:exo-alpha-sialidase [Blastococcus brunescens]|uniref:Exo-alpha-sialidase n=1 Tax=Blastococcus brunescens TaxID=1564165 RepID=A0ABZ1B369_9ACTN|nr:exo-alpha-sialidase [Blastococcus sp. BMG 8361]WRL65257.1 exo-alpha-sialidase [Blastococcus sp. BMG 8361]
MLAGIQYGHWGPTVMWSDDLGGAWNETDHGAIRFPEDTGAALARVWQLRPDSADRPDVVWAGAEPHSLWRSTDGGCSFDLVRGCTTTRTGRRGSPAAGRGRAHGLARPRIRPRDGRDEHRRRLRQRGRRRPVGAPQPRHHRDLRPGSAARVRAVRAQGRRRRERSRPALRAEPLRRLPQRRRRRVLDVDRRGLPADFGFPIVSSPHAPGTAWVIPLVADMQRVPPDGRLRVHRTRDAGATWAELGVGLPDGNWSAVMRDAFCADGHERTGLYFGTRDGCVYASADEGDTFALVADHLPDVLTVRAARLP